jgi:hypothetical protein
MAAGQWGRPASFVYEPGLPPTIPHRLTLADRRSRQARVRAGP